jgi:RNA polymerase sigma factor for flagellar operon FliA
MVWEGRHAFSHSARTPAINGKPGVSRGRKATGPNQGLAGLPNGQFFCGCRHVLRGKQLNRTERDQIVLENLPLVGYLVSEVAAKVRHHDRDDLASAGTLALIACAESYDATQGVPFGAYARRRILGAFTDEMRSADWATRTTRRRITAVTRVRDALTNTLGRHPSVEEVASALGVSTDDAAASLADAERSVAVLDETTADFLVAPAPSPEESLLITEQLRYVHAAVQSLPEKMRYIVEQVYFAERPIKDLAEELGLTHSAVSQQRAEGIRLLRDAMETHYAATPVPDGPAQRRISAPRRNAYLANVAELTAGGITRRHAPQLVAAETL